MIYVIAVHMEPSYSSEHEHIAQVQWEEPSKGQLGYSDRAAMVEFIRKGGDARVRDGQGEVGIVVVEANPPYIRTYADGRQTDNLLSLPRY